MLKQEYLELLQLGLEGIPKSDLEERLSFYGEIIDDRIEEGIGEEEAVASLGNPEDVVLQILEEIPLTRLVKEKVRHKRTLRVWETVLLVLGSPIWLSLLIAVAAVVLALYAAVWAVIISLWAAEAAIAACGLAGIAAWGFFLYQGHFSAAIAVLGAGLVCTGIVIFGFFGCKLATRGLLLLTKKICIGIKSRFIRKEGV